MVKSFACAGILSKAQEEHIQLPIYLIYDVATVHKYMI